MTMILILDSSKTRNPAQERELLHDKMTDPKSGQSQKSMQKPEDFSGSECF